MTFESGFRNPIGPIGGIAGVDVISKRIYIDDGGGTGEVVFALGNVKNLWRFYRLDYVVTYSAEGHATTGPHQQEVVVKLLDDPELLADAWRVELSLAVPATEVRNIAIAGTGFDVKGGIPFPIGVNAKILAEVTVGGTWTAGSFNKWNARILFTVLAREVSPN